MEHTNGGANGFRQGTPPRNAGNHRHGQHPAVQSHRKHQIATAPVISIPMLHADNVPICAHAYQFFWHDQHSPELPVLILPKSLQVLWSVILLTCATLSRRLCLIMGSKRCWVLLRYCFSGAVVMRHYRISHIYPSSHNFRDLKSTDN